MKTKKIIITIFNNLYSNVLSKKINCINFEFFFDSSSISKRVRSISRAYFPSRIVIDGCTGIIYAPWLLLGGGKTPRGEAEKEKEKKREADFVRGVREKGQKTMDRLNYFSCSARHRVV